MLGVTAESIRLWTQEGCPRRDDGSYIVAEVVTWLRQRERDKIRDELKAGDKKPTELNRKLAAEADLKELQLRQMRGELLPVEVHDERLARVIGGFATIATGQTQRFEREMRKVQTAVEARELRERIVEALMEGARSLADELDAEAATMAPEDDDEEAA